jgi:hypothetical protein
MICKFLNKKTATHINNGQPCYLKDTDYGYESGLQNLLGTKSSVSYLF